MADASWSIEGDAMVMTPSEKAKNIVTNQDFTNFELSLEWKISEGGNSGIMWAVIEDEKYEHPYDTGPEIQVLDNERHPDSFVGNGIHKAGSLYHIKTKIKGAFDKKETSLAQITTVLHPTPAVCGTPRDAAFAIIQELEGYNREFYTGFLGPLDLQNNTAQLYVNLRCMKISPAMAMLYVGGGITLDSMPQDEWQETKNKMATMLSVLGSMLP